MQSLIRIDRKKYNHDNKQHLTYKELEEKITKKLYEEDSNEPQPKMGEPSPSVMFKNLPLETTEDEVLLSEEKFLTTITAAKSCLPLLWSISSQRKDCTR
jgi:hypothetical protein